MAALCVYPDTSVFGGYYDYEFARWTIPFFEAVWRGEVRPVVSDLLIAEVDGAPPAVQALLARTLLYAERLPVDDASAALQAAYLAAGVVGARYADDALHVAQAVTAGVDALVTWNMRHMVDPRRARRYNEINVARGYGPLAILTPLDVRLTLEDDDEPSP
jgi:predicted nucleic acid-binding protein